jgi:hypothetical protein
MVFESRLRAAVCVYKYVYTYACGERATFLFELNLLQQRLSVFLTCIETVRASSKPDFETSFMVNFYRFFITSFWFDSAW